MWANLIKFNNYNKFDFLLPIFWDKPILIGLKWLIFWDCVWRKLFFYISGRIDQSMFILHSQEFLDILHIKACKLWQDMARYGKVWQMWQSVASCVTRVSVHQGSLITSIEYNWNSCFMLLVFLWLIYC